MAIYICEKCTGPLKPVNRFFSSHYVCERCLQKYDSKQESNGPLQLIIKFAFVAFVLAVLTNTKTLFTQQQTDHAVAIKFSIGILIASALYYLKSKYSVMRFMPIEDSASIYTRKDLKIVLTIVAATGVLLFLLLKI